MQTAGKKNKSTIDNVIIMNAMIEKQRQDNKNLHIVCGCRKMLSQTLVER